MKAITRIDKFYLFLGFILVIFAGLLTYALRTIFSSLSVASSINEELFALNIPHVNRNKLDEAINRIESKEFIPLDL